MLCSRSRTAATKHCPCFRLGWKLFKTRLQLESCRAVMENCIKIKYIMCIIYTLIKNHVIDHRVAKHGNICLFCQCGLIKSQRLADPPYFDCECHLSSLLWKALFGKDCHWLHSQKQSCNLYWKKKYCFCQKIWIQQISMKYLLIMTKFSGKYLFSEQKNQTIVCLFYVLPHCCRIC